MSKLFVHSSTHPGPLTLIPLCLLVAATVAILPTAALTDGVMAADADKRDAADNADNSDMEDEAEKHLRHYPYPDSGLHNCQSQIANRQLFSPICLSRFAFAACLALPI